MPEEHDPPHLQCLLWIALGLALWTIILFGVTYVTYWLVN
jgi:hypothetical protein